MSGKQVFSVMYDCSVASRFRQLRVLNLADNDLRTFPLSICNIATLVQLNLANNKLTAIPPSISKLKQLVNIAFVARDSWGRIGEPSALVWHRARKPGTRACDGCTGNKPRLSSSTRVQLLVKSDVMPTKVNEKRPRLTTLHPGPDITCLTTHPTRGGSIIIIIIIIIQDF